MADILELVYEYRRLLARRQLTAGVLSHRAEQRLLGLERLFGRDPDDRKRDFRRQHARCEVRLHATIQIGTSIEPVDVVDLGGGGLRIEPAPMMSPGQCATIRIVSPETGRMYLYTVEAKWCDRSASRSTMGMPFVGAPSHVLLAA